jgi:hypothetical protein
MKNRTGFISNSSSTSFIVDGDRYPSVLALAQALWRWVEKESWTPGSRTYLEQEHRRWQDQITTRQLDPDTPITYPEDGRVALARVDDHYLCEHLPWGPDYMMIMDRIVDDDETIPGTPIRETYFTYYCDYDVIALDPGQHPWNDPYWACHDGHAWNDRLYLENGELVCPICGSRASI